MIAECPGCARRYDVTGRPAGTQARCRCGTVFTLPDPPASAGNLSCPQCGAVVAPTERTCGFCAAELAQRACPRCFGQIFLGASFCRHCGAPVEVPATVLADGQAAPRNCPRCAPSVRLESQLVADALLDACPGCGGVFVDVDLLQRLMAEKRYAADRSGDPPPSTKTAPPAEQPGPLYIKCPDCDQHMIRRVFGKRSGVIVDICAAHGTWFDAEELQRAISFAQAGGLDRVPTGPAPVAPPSPAPPSQKFPPVLQLSQRRDSGFFEAALSTLAWWLLD